MSDAEMDSKMSLNIKGAVSMPFKGTQALIALAVGSALMLPSAFVQTHADHSAWIATVAWLFGLIVSGYQVRIMRAQYAGEAPVNMPSWGGNPVDLIKAVIANFLGALALVAVFGAILLAIFGICMWIFAGHSGGLTGVSGIGDVDVAALGASFIAILIALVVAIPLLAFAPMMEAHYAHEDRIGAIFEWRRIWQIARRRFWSILGVAILGGLVVTAIEAVAAIFFPLLAVVGFACATVMCSLFAQLYVSARAED